MPIITLWYHLHFQFSQNFFHDRFHEIMRSFSCWNGAAPLLPLLSRNFMGKFRLETLVSRNNAIFFLLKRSRFYLYLHEIMRSFSCWNGAVLPLLSRNFMDNFFLTLYGDLPGSFSRCNAIFFLIKRCRFRIYYFTWIRFANSVITTMKSGSLRRFSWLQRRPVCFRHIVGMLASIDLKSCAKMVVLVLRWSNDEKETLLSPLNP